MSLAYAFFAFDTGFFAAAEDDFAGFIGSPQQTNSQDSQPQGSSTRTTSPQSSHWYRSPFFLTKTSPPKKLNYLFLFEFIFLIQSLQGLLCVFDR